MKTDHSLTQLFNHKGMYVGVKRQPSSKSNHLTSLFLRTQIQTRQSYVPMRTVESRNVALLTCKTTIESNISP